MIKVFGEARSGTTYLEKLFDKHGLDILLNGVGNTSGWKHGFPVYTVGALHVLLMRDVHEWVRSMLTGFDARFNGLKEPFGGDQDHWGKWNNLIECRTAKYHSYVRFTNDHGAVLLKTEHLKEHPEVITEFTDVTEVQDIDKHVRLGIEAKDDPSRPELTEDQIKWIDRQTDPELESFVDELTIKNYAVQALR